MSIELVVVTPEGQAFSGPVEQVVLPGAAGEFGVLESHERFLSALEHGVMEIRTDSGSRFAALSDGFAEVTAERVVVMVDSCHEQHEIDVEAARATLASAGEELEALGSSDEDADRRADLEDAISRAGVHIEAHARH